MYVHANNTPGGYLHRVFLDGQPLVACIEASEEEGWARCFEVEAVPDSACGVPRFRLVTERKGDQHNPVEIMRFGTIRIEPI